MGTISSGVGLVSGIDIQGTVDQLIAIEERPRTIVQNQNTVLQSQSTALQSIAAQILSLDSAISPLQRQSNFQNTLSTSSNEDILTVTSGNTSPPGSYQFTVDRLVSTQQSISRGFADLDRDALPASSLTFESAAARLDSKTLLTELNGGQGVTRGRINITDRAGNTAEIDLSRATNVDDVLNTINLTSGINVTASVQDDRLVITDNNLATAVTTNIAITDATGFSGVAASFGIATAGTGVTTPVTPSGDTLTGNQIRNIGDDTLLASFNDNNGIRTRPGFNIADLTITDRAGTTFSLDLDGLDTIAEIRAEVEDVSGGSVTFGTSADGLGVAFTDQSGGGGNFTIAAANSSLAGDDLGVIQSVAADTITGSRQIAGINSRLVRNLQGGSIAALGTINISDRAGTAFTADLSAAVSVNDILTAINDAATAAGAGITAGLNATGNGLAITDTTGSTANTLDITNSGDLNLDASATESSVSSGNLQFRYVSEATRLAQLNNGQGVAAGRFTITDTAGNEATIDLRQGESTIGEVIDEINSRSTLAINARINDNGDGILLEDTNTATAAFAITVEEAGSSTAADLGILGAADSPEDALDGSFETTISIAAAETIEGTTLLADLNGGAGVDIEANSPDFEIQTASDETFSINLSGLTTTQEVIDRIATATGGLVTASINATDDGLRLVDTSTGTATFSVTGVNGSNAAEDLGINATDSDSDGVITGESVVVTTTLQDLADRINNSDAGVLATIINDGSPNSPFRLSLTSATTGSAGQFLLEDNGLNLGINPLIEGEDAVVFFGSSDPARSVLITSSSNSLDSVIQGATIDLVSATPQGAPPTTININRDTTPIVENIQSFVEAFNSVIDTFDQFDTFDTETEERGLLLGDPAIARARSGLFRLITQTFGDVEDQFTSLSQIGVRIASGARLEVDTERLNAAIATDVDAVQNLFTFQSTTRDEDNALVVTGRGVASTFTQLLDSLTDSVDGTFSRRVDTIDNQIEANQRRIDSLTTALDNRRARLTSEFNALEVTLSRLQGQQSSITNLANLAAQTRGG